MTETIQLALVGLFAAGIAAIISSMLVPLVIRTAEVLDAIDHPGERRTHFTPVPRLGGLAIIAGFGTSAIIVYLLVAPEAFLMPPATEILALVVGCLLITMVGAVDDVIGISVAYKFLIQFLAAGLLVHAGYSFDTLGLPFIGPVQLGVLSSVLSVLWIVGVTNAINLLDGLDGLASGVVAIIGVSFLIFALISGKALTVILMGAMVGACLGFLRHNWEPARIFMGDSGSLSLGFLLAIMSVKTALKGPAAISILVPILALGLPVVDTLLVMAARFVEDPRGGLKHRLVRMFRADRKHIHHLLLRNGMSRSRIVVGLYGLVGLFCLLSLIVASTRNPQLGWVFVLGGFQIVFAIRALGFARTVKGDLQLKRPQLSDGETQSAAERESRRVTAA